MIFKLPRELLLSVPEQFIVTPDINHNIVILNVCFYAMDIM